MPEFSTGGDIERIAELGMMSVPGKAWSIARSRHAMIAPLAAKAVVTAAEARAAAAALVSAIGPFTHWFGVSVFRGIACFPLRQTYHPVVVANGNYDASRRDHHQSNPRYLSDAAKTPVDSGYQGS